MAGGFRTRLTLTIIALVVVTAAGLSLASFLLVRSSLRSQLVDEAVARAEFNLVDLIPAEGLERPLDRETFEATRLAERFLLRGSDGLYVDFDDGDPYASQPGFLDTPATVDSELRDLAEAGQYGYQFVEVADEPLLVVAARRPGSDEVFYFYTDASVVGSAATDLGRFLLVGAGVVIVLAVLAAGAVARRVLRPIDAAGRAARRIAAGELTARVDVASDDEFGRLAETFNLMAESLQHQVGELEEAEARERQFVADVSHELRTPLTSLSTEAQLLEAGLAELSGSARRAAELLVVDVARLRRLVDELLEISRLDAGADESEVRRTDIRRLLEAIVSDRLPHARVVGDQVEEVACDRRGIERVVANLLDNASAHAPGAEVTVRYGLSGGAVVVRVADEGPGIAEELLPRLFDRFFKADPSRQGGSGLGLAIARRHAMRMGGELTAKRRTGGGLEFELRVPVTVPLQTGAVGEILETDADGEQ